MSIILCNNQSSLVCISVLRMARIAIASNKENDPISLTIGNKVFPINYRSTLLGHAQSFPKKSSSVRHSR